MSKRKKTLQSLLAFALTLILAIAGAVLSASPALEVQAAKNVKYQTSTTSAYDEGLLGLPQATKVKIKNNKLVVRGSLMNISNTSATDTMVEMLSYKTRKWKLAKGCKIIIGGGDSPSERTLSKKEFNQYDQSGLLLIITIKNGKVAQLLYTV